MKKLLTILICALTLIGCNHESSIIEPNATDPESETKSVSPIVYKTFANEEFTIQYPEDWDEFDITIFNNPMIKMAVKNNNSENSFADNINVVVEPNNFSSMSAKDIAEYAVENLKQNQSAAGMDNFKKLKFEDKMFFSRDAGILICEYKHSATGAQVILTQFIVPLESNIYTVSISLSNDSYKSIGEDLVKNVFGSFVVSDIEKNAEESQAASQNQATNGSYEWNLADENPETNGNVIIALDYLIESGPLTEGSHEDIAKVFKAPWDYYGKPIAFEGIVSLVQDYPPESETFLRSEVLLSTEDNTIIDILSTVPSGNLKEDDAVSINGLVVGRMEVENAIGGTFTHLIVITNNLE